MTSRYTKKSSLRTAAQEPQIALSSLLAPGTPQASSGSIASATARRWVVLSLLVAAAAVIVTLMPYSLPTAGAQTTSAAVDGDFTEWWASSAKCQTDSQGWRDGRDIRQADGVRVQPQGAPIPQENMPPSVTSVVRATVNFNQNIHRQCATYNSNTSELLFAHATGQTVQPAIYGDYQWFVQSCSLIDTVGDGDPEYAACAKRERHSCSFSGLNRNITLSTQPCFDGNYSGCNEIGCSGSTDESDETIVLRLFECDDASCTSRSLLKSYGSQNLAYGSVYQQRTFETDSTEFLDPSGNWSASLLYYFPTDDMQVEFAIPLADIGGLVGRACVTASASEWETNYSSNGFNPLPRPMNSFADSVNDATPLCAIGSYTDPIEDELPTSTPRPAATATPRATSTPQPAATATPRPAATATPRPTSTPRPAATATPRPTSTPRPAATATPRPTSTPRPAATATPRPTSTPRPAATATPRPTSTATAPTDLLISNFDGTTDWTFNPGGVDTATTGAFSTGSVEATVYEGFALQPSGAASGSKAMVTDPRAGASAGSYDMDSGRTRVESPSFVVPDSGYYTLSFSYFFAHLSNSDSSDYFRIRVIADSVGTTIFEQRGSASYRNGVWEGETLDLSVFAGQRIRLRVEAADDGSRSLVEAGIDNVRVSLTAGQSPSQQPPASAGVVRIQNVDTGEYLTTVGSSEVGTAASKTSTQTQWRLIEVSEGRFGIQNVGNSRFLDWDGDGNVDTSSSDQTNTDRQWDITVYGDGYLLRNVRASRYLDSDSGSAVDTTTLTNSDSQWYIIY